MRRSVAVVLALCVAGCAATSASVADRVYTRIACDPGTEDCDGRLSTGCETDTAHDATACGACGRACAPGERCDDGRCAR